MSHTAKQQRESPPYHKRAKRNHLTLNEKTIIYNVYKYIKDTWPTDRYMFKKEVHEKTASVMGVGITTVYRVLKEYKKSLKTDTDTNSPSSTSQPHQPSTNYLQKSTQSQKSKPSQFTDHTDELTDSDIEPAVDYGSESDSNDEDIPLFELKSSDLRIGPFKHLKAENDMCESEDISHNQNEDVREDNGGASTRVLTPVDTTLENEIKIKDEVSDITIEETQITQMYETPNLDIFFFDWKPITNIKKSPIFKSNLSNFGYRLFPSPYSAFIAIWNRKIMTHIVRETNKYGAQMINKLIAIGKSTKETKSQYWEDTNVDELYIFFAILLASSICVKMDVSEYWSSQRFICGTPGFQKYMSYKRFHQLHSYLHFNSDIIDPNVSSRTEAKIIKIAPIIDHLNEKFQKLYDLDVNLVVSNSLIKCKDKTNKIIFEESPLSMKSYELIESQTGYLWRFFVDDTQLDEVLATDMGSYINTINELVLNLLKGLENRRHIVWMNSDYTSPLLARTLKLKGFNCVGTLKPDRPFVPTFASTLSLGEICGKTSGDINIILWQCPQTVTMISTYHGTDSNAYSEPMVVQDYNECMSAVEKRNKILAMYPTERPDESVWYKSFFKRLLNISAINASILYNRTVQRDVFRVTKHSDFRKALIKDLLDKHAPKANGNSGSVGLTKETADRFTEKYGSHY